MLTAGGGRLAGVDVADDDDVDMSLVLTAICQPLILVELMLAMDETRQRRSPAGTHPMLTVCGCDERRVLVMERASAGFCDVLARCRRCRGRGGTGLHTKKTQIRSLFVV